MSLRLKWAIGRRTAGVALVFGVVGCGTSRDPLAEHQTKDGHGDENELALVKPCSGDPNNSKNLESGSIGRLFDEGTAKPHLWLRDDNGNCNLPRSFRSWWYYRFDAMPVDKPVELALHNRGWHDQLRPVFSYDRKKWMRMVDTHNPQAYELIIRQKFEKKQVFFARTFPYTYSDLLNLLRKLCPGGLEGQRCGDDRIAVESLGRSVQGRALPLLRISRDVDQSDQKPLVWIHARTHPGETGGSYVIEGLLNFLVQGQSLQALELLDQVELRIVPMHNVDGVVVGNYRTTPASDNLELGWLRAKQTRYLRPESPLEVRQLHAAILKSVATDRPVLAALNLHSSNSPVDKRAFFFPHFGPQALGYSYAEARLWQKQLRFIELVSRAYAGRIEPPPAQGGDDFVTRTYPESWWWANFQDQVMAITMETTYHQAGFPEGWVTPDRLRQLGEALGRALAIYVNEQLSAL